MPSPDPSPDTSARHRAVLSFSVEGLSAREELLLKSFVRLLSHRTRHVWLYSARPMDLQTDFRADLRVVPDGTDTLLIPPAQQVLTLGTVQRKRDAYLCLPLHAQELETVLNHLGDGIVSSRAAPKPSAQPAPDVTPLVAATNALVPPHETVRLLRWPPASLLSSAARMRLATLMTGPPLTLATLQQRSGQPVQVCAEFVNDLRRAGCIGAPPAASPAPSPPPSPQKVNAVPKVQASLLARIRSRFGFQTGSRA